MDYKVFLFALIVAIAIILVLFCVSFFLVPKNYYLEKISPYECGFDPFEDTRSNFDVRFYLVAILFIIFDLEIVFLIPWVLVLGELTTFGFVIGIIFVIILGIGFVYELLEGVVDAV